MLASYQPSLFPPARFAATTSPIIIGVLAVNPFDGQLPQPGRSVRLKATYRF